MSSQRNEVKDVKGRMLKEKEAMKENCSGMDEKKYTLRCFSHLERMKNK